MTKTQTVAAMAERTGLSKAQVRSFFDELIALACQEAVNGMVIPGMGKLVLSHRKARMGRNPATGAPVAIPAKTVLKFRLSKSCKDAVLSA
jgi:DNA-binding protein HU-beta